MLSREAILALFALHPYQLLVILVVTSPDALFSSIFIKKQGVRSFARNSPLHAVNPDGALVATFRVVT